MITIIFITICGLITQLVMVDKILTNLKDNRENIISSTCITIASELMFYKYALTNTIHNNCVVIFQYHINAYIIYFALAFFSGLFITGLLKVDWSKKVKDKVEQKIDNINL